ncbi:MAG: beta-lactamase family protein [Clostridiales bacterium]|nr:beta-lactamase family protein [Clostridiales bacterium]
MNQLKLEDFIESIPKRWGVPGCQCSVYVAHRRVFYHAVGHRDAQGIEPAREDDLYWIFSVSKLFACVAAMQLIEKGKLRLDDPVSRFLPSWANMDVMQGNGVVPCTVRPTIFHLMTMTAGLNYEMDTPVFRKLAKQKGLLFTLRDAMDALSDQPLDFEPGAHFRYSLCHDVLGAIIEVVSGMDIESYMRKNIADPLGARDLTFFPTSEQMSRFAAQYRYNEEEGTLENIPLENAYIASPTCASTGAGLCAGINEIALFADALANEGMGSTGKRILNESSIRRMAEDSLTPTQKNDFWEMKPDPYSYGLGVRTLTREDRGAPKGEFGWDGAAGSYVLIDPTRRMSLVYTQHILEHGPVYSEIHPQLRDTLYQAVEVR